MGWNGLSGIDFSRRAEPREREEPVKREAPQPRSKEFRPEARPERPPARQISGGERQRERPSIQVPEAGPVPDMEKEE